MTYSVTVSGTNFTVGLTSVSFPVALSQVGQQGVPGPRGDVSISSRKNVAAVLADTVWTYATGQNGTVTAGDIVTTEAEGFSYEVAASGATDQHVTTAGGVKLYYAGFTTAAPADGIGIVVGTDERPAGSIGAGSLLVSGHLQFPNRMPGTRDLRAIVGGYDNEIGAGTGADSGGLACVIFASHHSVIGGNATHATITGGSFHEITNGDYSVITGGQLNVITGGTDYGTISGGGGNEINMGAGDDYGTIGGGFENSVTGRFGGVFCGNTNVASGIYSVVFGGLSNTSSGLYSAVTSGTANLSAGRSSVVAGGESNTITAGTAIGDYSGILAGFQNVLGSAAASRFSGIVGGRQNTINAEYAGAVGGRENTVTGEAAVAIGYGAVTSAPGSFVQAGGYFSAAGDSQVGTYVMRRQTTDATPLELRLGSTLGSRLVLDLDSAYTFLVMVVARNAGAEETAGYEIKGMITRASGGLVSIPTAITKTILHESVSSWDATVKADTSNSALQVEVTGEAGKTIKWVADVRMVKVIA